MSKLIAVYGLLRRGHKLYEELGGQKMLCFRGIYRIPGYKMFSLNDEYPVVVHTHKKEDKVIVEVFVTPNETADKVNMIEQQAGYNEFNININEDKVSIYLYKGNVDKLKEVPQGDWGVYWKSLSKTISPVEYGAGTKDPLPTSTIVLNKDKEKAGKDIPNSEETPAEPSKPIANKVKLTMEDMKSLLCELTRDYLSPKDLQTKYSIIYDKAKYFLDKFLLEKSMVKETITVEGKSMVVYKLTPKI